MDERTGGDQSDRATEPAAPAGLRWWQLIVLWIVFLGAPWAIFFGGLRLLTTELSDTVPDGQCEGIGFGCTLSDRDGVELLAVVYGLPVVAAITAVFGAVAGSITIRSGWHEARWVVLLGLLVVAIGSTGIGL